MLTNTPVPIFGRTDVYEVPITVIYLENVPRWIINIMQVRSLGVFVLIIVPPPSLCMLWKRLARLAVSISASYYII